MKNLNITLILIIGFSIQADIEQLKKYQPYAYSTLATLQNSYLLADDCIKNNIEGDFVECGVAHGVQIASMYEACRENNSYRTCRLFDSFEGIPLAGPKDTAQPGIGAITHNTNVKDTNELLISSGVACVSLEQVKQNMKTWDIDFKFLKFYKGWFQHTLPIEAQKIEKIAILRLDGDLYESTKVCLDYLYDKVTKGGYIIIDDYGSLRGCVVAVHEFFEERHINPKIIYVEGGINVVYWQKN